MRYYFENNCGDTGYFTEDDLILAIYSVWNIEANLYTADKLEDDKEKLQLIFTPWESNEFNSELLKDYGYYMTDGEKRRQIRRIADDVVIRYDWSEVRSL